MKLINQIFVLIFVFPAVVFPDSNEPNRSLFVFRGTADASAAVSLTQGMFTMADDENNILRVYKIGKPKLVCSYDLTGFLSIVAEHPEADIEGATKIGNRIYWITSHGRNQDGKVRPNRYRFFAADIKVKNGKVRIEPVGRASWTLVHNLLKEESIVKQDLANAAGFSAGKLKAKQRLKLAPRRDGLNIEALCAAPDGNTIYIGFRNPLHKSTTESKKAIVIPLKNPDSVVEKAAKPLFAKPLLWELQGLGIRAMEYSVFHQAFFVIAGSVDQKHNFALFKWSGSENQQPELVRKIIDLPEDFTPEALIPFQNSDSLFVLSDDGSLIVDISNPSDCMEDKLLEGLKCQNKHLTDPNKKTFRAIRLKP